MFLGKMWVVFLLQALLLRPQNANGIIVKITYVESAVAKGGVCLDGSPPAYHIDKGFGAGINNWLIQLEGGGWCNNVTTCLARRTTRLGSSTKMATELAFSAILSSKPQFNPDFYNWNRVKVRYCDGASFTGDVEEVNPTTKLYYRGARLFRAIIEDLLAKGMNRAQNALLSGCSAGGLGAILNCENFRSLLPAATNVKCMSDAGYFINSKDITGVERIQQFYDEVVSLHGSAKNLPSSCTSKMKPGLCFFPQNVVSGLRTPYFALNAAYDSWQIKNILAPGAADPHGHWHNCKSDIQKCDAAQLQTMHGFRQNFLQAFGAVGSSPARGFFINSCYAHCQSEQQMYWLTSTSPRLFNVPIWKAVGDWYFDRALAHKEGECPYPCDKTCINRTFE